MLKLQKTTLAAGLAVLAIPVGAAVLPTPASAGGIDSCNVTKVRKAASAVCLVRTGTVRLKVVCNDGTARHSKRVGPGYWRLGPVACVSGIAKKTIVS